MVKSVVMQASALLHEFRASAFRIRLSAFYSTSKSSREIAKSYRILGCPLDSDQETVRQAFIELVKKYHPDSKTDDADSSKFQEIEEAYRHLQEKFAHDRFNVNDCEGEYGLYYKEKEKCEEQDIQHTAPQHRQYLSHGGYGSGTPFQRERQYGQYRAAKAAENVTDYKVSRIVDNDSKAVQKRVEKGKVKDIRTGLGMDRLVEDLIQESMMRGEFDNLPGTGKPLNAQSKHNPYVDFVTHKMNEVLIDNGFTPQWITLSKEIREQKDQIREILIKTRRKVGPLPFNAEDNAYWTDTLELLQNDAKDLNAKIDFFNLVVPILNKQMTQFELNVEAEKILREHPCLEKEKVVDEEPSKDAVQESNLLVKLVNQFLNRL